MGNFEIVGTAVNDFHLKLKESLLILKMKPPYTFVLMILDMLFGNNQ